MAMGVPIEEYSWLLGDNQSVITQSTIPSSVLTKRHNALAYHRVRWAVATGLIKFVKIDGKENPADMLTKYLTYSEVMPILKPILFWRGETTQPASIKGELHPDASSNSNADVTEGDAQALNGERGGRDLTLPDGNTAHLTITTTRCETTDHATMAVGQSNCSS
jgi:hypothetical protein